MDGNRLGTNALVWCVTAALTLAAVGSAAAQPAVPDTGGRVFGTVGASFGDGGTSAMVSAGAGLRLTRHLGIDLEIVHVPALDLDDDDGFFIQGGGLSTLGLAPPIGIERDGSITAFLAKFTAEFPIARDRLFGFITGGGGVGHLSERIRVRSRPGVVAPDRPAFRPDVVRPLIFPPPEVQRSESGLGLTVGGGLDVRLWRGFGIGVDARWLRLLSNRADLDSALVAARVSYRF